MTAIIPIPKKWFVDGFGRYCRRYLSKHFHSLSVHASGLTGTEFEPSTPIIVYGNHAGWWDPIVAMLLNQRYFSSRTLYAPIDAKALESYKIFQKLGFFGVQLDSFEGARAFLEASRQIFSRTNSSLWITPEGKFADPRDHSQPLMPGLAHLSRDRLSPWVIPLAIEYTFWEERQPEALAMFGPPFRNDPSTSISKGEWGGILTRSLRQTQLKLAELSIRRASQDFEIVVKGQIQRNWYDLARSLMGILRGKPARVEHGNKLT